MSDVASVLERAGIKRGLVVDDAYQDIPFARDLSEDEDLWAQFFEDLTDDDKKAMAAEFLDFHQLRGDELRPNDKFVATLWHLKESSERIRTLFSRYLRDRANDLSYLEALTTKLREYGVDCSTGATVDPVAAENVNLIVIDLFLGSTQDDRAIGASIEGLRNLIVRRRTQPPLVILMSRSSRLASKQKEFRDQSGLFESAFRIITKTDLLEEGKLARILTILAEHYQDSTRLAGFLNAWRTGLARAGENTAYLIRTLDLADLAQVRQLLLADESEQPGSYLVDIFDAVLQHEIEREDSIIDAAIELNRLDPDAYPPPYVAGSPDLQAIAYRCLFQNNERLRLVPERDSLVAFGDILKRKTTSPPAEVSNSMRRFEDIAASDVLLVLTPSCDLQRGTMNRILLLKGSLIALTSATWSTAGESARTAVCEFGEQRFQILWDLKHIEAISTEDLRKSFDALDGFAVVARLRESHALEVQQKLLSSLGRIGLVAAMPATFPTEVSAYLPGPDSKLFPLSVPALTENPGVFFIGRKADRRAVTLVLCEEACEGLHDAISAIDIETIHPTTRDVVSELRNTGELMTLTKGVDVTRLGPNKRIEVTVRRKGVAEPEVVEDRTIAFIGQPGEWIQETLKNNQLKNAGMFLVVSEQLPQSALDTLAPPSGATADEDPLDAE
ncbi:MAG TPA: hypothetical protein VNP98_11980 [Chthoniobacterales bacterium]|nr:hypothetical protein [Chthoniobacterales bacterium]